MIHTRASRARLATAENNLMCTESPGSRNNWAGGETSDEQVSSFRFVRVVVMG